MMKIPGDCDFGAVTVAKIQALRAKIAFLKLDLSLVEEKFVKGSGHGGQKINKTNNAVELLYPPLNIRVKCQRERSRAVNRFLALRELVEKIEIRISPATSERLKGIEKIRKRKARRRER